MRKGYTKFTLQDFEAYPIWELQSSLTTAEPYQGRIPFKPDKARAYFVKTSFTLADKTAMTGWTMICVPPYEVIGLNPTILTDSGPVDLTKLAAQPKDEDVESVYSRLGKNSKQVFPLNFQTAVSVPKGPAAGNLKGFIHRLAYRDENGWSQHQDFCYTTAVELETSIKKYQQEEAAKKAALEPSKEEKALFQAARIGDAKTVSAFVAKGVSLNRGGVVEEGGYTRKKVTPLMIAAEGGHAETVQLLLKAGADIHLVEETNEPRQGNRTALACACRKNQLGTARLLLEADADVNHKLSFGHTILDEACNSANSRLIKLLLESGAHPNASCGRADYFALERAVSADRLDVVKLLLDFKADINGTDDDEETPLIQASRLLRLDIVNLLLARGADVGRKTRAKLTALHRVVVSASDLDPEYDDDAKERFSKAMKIVSALVEHGADVNAKTSDGEKPLALAKECRFPQLASYLKRKGAKG